ncbi:hypothetical protein DCW30_05800 [Streptomyces alfalfae]|uniref:Uncharacterized protein n=1 Tax=Streptomyces alfalfae TaxID=1642299 RepID=A0ABM6GWQ6_9ACTN|nr:hypothetical protein [Streptomyces alfalfae]APY88185.1 hypothetical protein A7J05_23070 [Streptomyces alfalfae]AYA18582.1 hypothetical protein D3X13_22185 [Streptomyces fradiae]RXX46537.1 hypothetical protein DCW30_05800 [Streptomyces alfalfae]RZM90050.1 hypothetical protein D4104_25735 [Streptomyces alfalfae]
MSAPTTVQWLRAAAGRICIGSQRLAVHLSRRLVARARALYARIRGWLSSSSGLSRWLKVALLVLAYMLLRKIVLGVAGGIYRRIESGAWSWMLWPAALLWLIAAYRAGHPNWKPKAPAAAAAAEEPEPEAEQPPTSATSTTEQPPAGPPPVSSVALVAAVRDVGTPHAQLRPLAEHLGTTTDAVRAAAAGLGWPVKDVRMAGRSASAGLRWDEAPSLPPLDPSPGVVGAGQRADDNDDDRREEGAGEGLRVKAIGHGGAIVYDPAETIRHHKTHH